jgi:PHD/YefM family antitoxin component YafN of YafNO toxin-antitoxin module
METMRTRTRATIIPIAEAERNLRKVLRAVDRTGFVQLTRNGKARYHISKEENEETLLARLEASVKDHRGGKTKVLKSLADL